MAAQITPDRNNLTDRLDHWAVLVGRMRPGVSLAKAETALSAIYPPLRDQDIAKKLRASRDAQAIYSVLALPPASAA